MKTSWLGAAVLLPLLSACDAYSSIKVDSVHVSPEQANAIKTNIQTLYPDITLQEQHAIADVAVKAIENLVFVEGGSFDMGDFKGPCEIPSKTRERMDWSPEHKQRGSLNWVTWHNRQLLAACRRCRFCFLPSELT